MAIPFEPYSLAEIERAIAMKSRGFSWAHIAGSLDRPQRSLEATVSRHLSGKHITNRVLIPEQNRTIEALVYNTDLTVTQIAQQVGLRYHTCYYRLRHMGLDKETIAEIRAARRMVA